MISLEIEPELCSSFLSLNILMKRFFARDSRCFHCFRRFVYLYGLSHDTLAADQ